MAGVNLKYTRSRRIWAKVLKLLGRKPRFNVQHAVKGKFCFKAGAPVTNTADDQPNAVHDICYDTTNHHAYISTLNTNSTTHTWVELDA